MNKVKKMSGLVALSQLKKYVKLNDEKTMKGTFIQTLEKENIFDKPVNKTTELHLVKLGDKSVLVPLVKKEDIQPNPIEDKALSFLLSKIKNQNDRDIVKQYITQQNMQEVINIGLAKRQAIAKQNEGDGADIDDITKQLTTAKTDLQKRISELKSLEELKTIVDGEEYKKLVADLKENKLNKTAGYLERSINNATRRLTTSGAIQREVEAQQKETVGMKTEAVRKREEAKREAIRKAEEGRQAKEAAKSKAESTKVGTSAMDDIMKDVMKRIQMIEKAKQGAEKTKLKEDIKRDKAEAVENAKEEMKAFPVFGKAVISAPRKPNIDAMRTAIEKRENRIKEETIRLRELTLVKPTTIINNKIKRQEKIITELQNENAEARIKIKEAEAPKATAIPRPKAAAAAAADIDLEEVTAQYNGLKDLRQKRIDQQNKAEASIEKKRKEISSTLKEDDKAEFKQIIRALDTAERNNFMDYQKIVAETYRYKKGEESKADYERNTNDAKRKIKENDAEVKEIKEKLAKQLKLSKKEIDDIMYQNVKY